MPLIDCFAVVKTIQNCSVHFFVLCRGRRMEAEISADELQNNIIICLNFGGKVTSISLRHSGWFRHLFIFYFVISSASCKAEQLEFQLGTVEVKWQKVSAVCCFFESQGISHDLNPSPGWLMTNSNLTLTNVPAVQYLYTIPV